MPPAKLPAATVTWVTAPSSRLVQDVGATMAQVVNSVRRVTTIAAEIRNASGEQSAGIAEIGDALAHMDRTTRQNAALGRQAPATAKALR